MLRSSLKTLIHSPLFWIVLLAAVLRLAGLFWGMPGSDGWDDDGVAPRNFLVGLAQTYVPGKLFTYPPLHMILLAIPCLPVLLFALFHAPSFAGHDVVAEMIRTPYMTYFAVTARLVDAAMSLATIVIVARMAELVGGKRAGWLTAGALSINTAFTYYGQVTNLDAPCLFWSALSLYAFMRLIANRDLKQIRYGALAAAAAIATKDQAYAVFALAIPAALALWLLLDDWPRKNRRALSGAFLKWGGISLLLLLLVDGAITNPTGFAARLAFLTGPASQDYAQYAHGWSGLLALMADMGRYFTRYYPLGLAVVAGLGIVQCVVSLRRAQPVSIAALLPLLAMISFTVAFNFVALRSEVRFLLPQSLFLAFYAGLAADWLLKRARPIALVAVVLIFAVGLWRAAAIPAAMLNDPRYAAEQWLRERVHPGDTIETYGLNAFLPRFPADSVVTRLDVKPAKKRNPLPMVRDIDAPFEALAARHPRYIVVSRYWAGRFLDEAHAPKGQVVQTVNQLSQEHAPARRYFQALFGEQLGYRIAYRADYHSGVFPAPRGYESLVQSTYIFERKS